MDKYNKRTEREGWRKVLEERERQRDREREREREREDPVFHLLERAMSLRVCGCCVLYVLRLRTSLHAYPHPYVCVCVCVCICVCQPDQLEGGICCCRSGWAIG